MASMRSSFSGRDSSGSRIFEMSSVRPACRWRAPPRAGSAPEWSAASRAGAAARVLLPISASASTERSHTHQSLSLVASIRWLTARSSLVWLRISMAARRRSSSWSRARSQHGVDDLGAADLAQRIAGTAAHPPVVVLDRLQQVLDRLGVADLVQHLDRRAARVFVLVLQHRDQVLDRFGIIGADQHVDGAVLHVDLGVLAAAGRPSRRRSARPCAPARPA